MGNLDGYSKLVVSVLLLLGPIFIEAQTTMTTTTEPTPPPIPGPSTTKLTETTTEATSTKLEATSTKLEAESTTKESTQSSTIAGIVATTIETNSPYNLANEPAKIIGIAIGVALLCLLIILVGIALQKHIRHQRIKKEEATPPKDFQNPVQMSTVTTEATV